MVKPATFLTTRYTHKRSNMAKITTIFLLFGLISAAVVYFVFPDWIKDPEPPEMKPFEWWGRGAAPAGAEKAPIVSKPFKIEVKPAEIEDLKRRLASTRYSEPLENSNFDYGFPGSELKKLVDYWMNKYDWPLQVKALNKYNHYKANIEGIDVHYMRVTPKVDKNIKVIPLLMIHGWPGSFTEFMKIIPLLTTPNANQNFVFDVICPSIPGYGYSEAPHKKGFNVVAAARIFSKLMASLKIDSYYAQGGDWGSFVASNMGVFYPKQVRGVQLNMINVKFGGPRFIWNFILGHINKAWVLDEGQTRSIFPFPQFFGNIILETGYLHIQATKPDTVGSALSDSPAGLAAYIVEKFSTWANDGNKHLPDGGLSKTKYTLDDILTNVMVYWTTNSITSSTRFYKENLSSAQLAKKLESLPIKVPAGISLFANDLIVATKAMAQDLFRDLVLFRHQKTGGHFAALEEPQILAKDIIDFVRENENRAKETQNKKK